MKCSDIERPPGVRLGERGDVSKLNNQGVTFRQRVESRWRGGRAPNMKGGRRRSDEEPVTKGMSL